MSYWEQRGVQALNDHLQRPQEGDYLLTVFRRLRRLTRTSAEDAELRRGFYGRLREVSAMSSQELDEYFAG
jgi:hypothetical protein